jgi:hypothetical protein
MEQKIWIHKLADTKESTRRWNELHLPASFQVLTQTAKPTKEKGWNTFDHASAKDCTS